GNGEVMGLSDGVDRAVGSKERAPASFAFFDERFVPPIESVGVPAGGGVGENEAPNDRADGGIAEPANQTLDGARLEVRVGVGVGNGGGANPEEGAHGQAAKLVTSRRRTIFAGTPAAVAWAGTSSSTTAFAPMRAPSPIVTGPMTLAPAPMKMSFPSCGL